MAWRALLVAAFPAAICEAMQRPNMRFVPGKSQDQQARLMVLRARQGFVTECTACNLLRRLTAMTRWAGSEQVDGVQRLARVASLRLQQSCQRWVIGVVIAT